MRKIGIIEDDPKLSRELKEFLVHNGYTAEIVEEGEYCSDKILAGKMDMLLLDIGLPGIDGRYLCREIRRVSEMPVIMITSDNSEITEMACMTYGADDFISKPFNPQILLLRMEAVLKRVYKETASEEIEDLGVFILDTARSMVSSEKGKIELTKNELKILYYLVQHKNVIVSRNDIIAYLWDSEMFVDDNTLTVNITRLRGKLEQIGVKDIIQTKRGQGYVLVCSF